VSDLLFPPSSFPHRRAKAQAPPFLLHERAPPPFFSPSWMRVVHSLSPPPAGKKVSVQGFSFFFFSSTSQHLFRQGRAPCFSPPPPRGREATRPEWEKIAYVCFEGKGGPERRERGRRRSCCWRSFPRGPTSARRRVFPFFPPGRLVGERDAPFFVCWSTSSLLQRQRRDNIPPLKGSFSLIEVEAVHDSSFSRPYREVGVFSPAKWRSEPFFSFLPGW